METARSSHLRFHRILTAVLFLGAGLIFGCEDGGGTDVTGPTSKSIQVEDIILVPKAPMPGDTVRVTAVVTSPSTNPGDFVKYQWTSTGGRFLENDESSVRWEAPSGSSIYKLTVAASNSVSSTGRTVPIFVGTLVPLIGSGAGEFHPSATGDTLYYLSPTGTPGTAGFKGFVLRRRFGATDQTVVASPRQGFQFAVSRDRTLAAAVVDTAVSGAFVQPKNVFVTDALAGAEWKVVTGDPAKSTIRKNQYTGPRISRDGTLITFQGFVPDTVPPAQGGVDQYLIHAYDVAVRRTTRATFSGRNFHPSFSSDGRFLVFVSDRSGNLVWELYALPVSGRTVTPDSVPGALVRLTTTGGLMGSANVPPSDLRRAWSPSPAVSKLAIVDVEGRLRLVATDGSPSIPVDLPEKVRDFAWSPDGRQLLVSTGNILYTVDLVGAAKKIHTSATGDVLTGLSWSPNGSFAIYAVSRQANMWYELFDVGGGLALTGSVRITSSKEKGLADPYSGVMSIRGAWHPGGEMVYLLSFSLTSSPRASTLDLSGIGP